MTERLEFEAKFKDGASAGVRRLGKTLAEVKPSHGMAAAQKWMESFGKGADKTVAAIRPVTGLMNSVGVGGLAASLSIGEMVKQFKELADSTLTMRELGRQSRISATDIARLQYAAGKLHVDPAAMSGAIGSWSSKMLEFRMHTSQFYRDLMRQNADVAAKIESDSPIDGLKRALDFISRIKDPQVQKRWADDAGLGDLVPMLGKGPDGLAAAFVEAGREVKPITQEMQDAADRFNEATNRFNQTWANFKNDLGPSILDPLSHTLDKLDDGLKFAAKYPGDAAAAAATIAGSFAGLYARFRIMRGSKLAGGGEFGAAAGEMTGAAREQAKAGGSLIEAALELKQAAAALQGKGVPGTGGGPGESGPGGKSPGYASLTLSGFLAAMNLGEAALNAPGLDEEGQRRREANSAAGDAAGQAVKDATGGWFGTDALRDRLFGPGRDITDVFSDLVHGRSGTGKWSAPDRYGVEARARSGDLKRDVQEGSKAGIIQGLREIAQEQDLAGQEGASANAGGGRMLGRGAANMRYGRHGGGGYGGTPVPDAPYNGKNIEGLSPAASKQYAAILGNRESGNRYGSTNPYGYAGRWQFGASALAENGYVRPGTSNAGLRNPGAWTGKGGASSMANWLANKGGVQDQAFGEYTNRHYAQLKAAGVIRDGMSPSEVAGWLAAAHLKGVGGAISLSRGHDNVDANGTSASSYRRMMQGVGSIAPAPAGAGTPAPSAAAISDAERMAAQLRIINGGRDPKDRALIERYKAQQAQPQAHAAGGPIRGPGTGTSDSIPAWLSDGEFVVRAGAAQRFLPLLHAINGGHLPGFAGGGPVGKPVTVHRKPWVVRAGFGVDKRFYPASSAGISDAEGRANRLSWRDFFRRPARDGGMGASWATTLGAMAMMQGESGRGLNTKLYDWDVNGPSGGVDQLHDVTTGKYAGRLHRLSDAMTDAMVQHVDWQDRTFQQAHFRKEATGSMWWAWRKMLAAKSAAGALRAGVNDFENPAQHDLELMRRAPNIVRLAREAAADGAMGRREMDPVEIDIRHHPHTGRPIVTAGAGRGVKLNIRTAPTMRPT